VLKGGCASAQTVPAAKYVEGVFELSLAGCSHKTRLVVSKHPERTPETPLVEEIVSAFQ
jgi:hypothetical protein